MRTIFPKVIFAASFCVLLLPAVAHASGTLLRRLCSDCHADGAAEGGVSLDTLLLADGLPESSPSPPSPAWVAIWKNLQASLMPPADHQPQPTTSERQELIHWIEKDIFRLTPEDPDPGHVVLRRLNRVEYVNTIRDLTGVQIDVTGELPPDDTGHGFDTIGEVLSTSPLLVERYLALATEVGQRVLSELAAHRERTASPDSYPAKLSSLFGSTSAADDKTAAGRWLAKTVTRIGSRGYRRTLDEASQQRLAAVAEATVAGGGTIDEAVVAALTAVLASPRFLFREERAAENSPEGRRAVLIDEFSLASRLSYFLWSTMPDDRLLELAAARRLRDQLDEEIARMIADPKADAFGRNFVGQWLQIRDVPHIAFDLRRILGIKDSGEANKIFSSEVRQAMQQETEMLFLHLLRENQPATDLLIGKQTFLNEPLARFYGIDDVKGREMRLVSLAADSHRRGLLTHASFLAVTSNPTRTSPVKRGLFILENLLGTPPPPAPPNVPALEEVAAKEKLSGLSMREALEQHRREPLCNSCHARFDPLGLAVERYNAIGQYRSDADIDTSGQLITGESFTDVATLAQRIATDRRDDFHRCLAEKMLTFAIGRGIEYYDAPAVDAIVTACSRNSGLATLVKAVIHSVPFQMRRVSNP
jgi:hypothetical protein